MAGNRRRQRTVADLAGFEGLGAAVRQLRQEKQLTQAQLANRTALSAPTISDIERGKQDITWGNLRRLARGLEVQLGAFLDLSIDLAPGSGGDELRRDRSRAARQE